MKYTELDTPSLLIDKSRLLRNLADMQRYADENGAALRPHTKTHKCPEIAKMQLEAAHAALPWQKPARRRSWRRAVSGISSSPTKSWAI